MAGGGRPPRKATATTQAVTSKKQEEALEKKAEELGIKVEPLVLELVAQGEELRKELITEKNERLLYTIACKSAVKANMRMSKIEMETLVRNVLRLKNINTCPHGRPIIVTMSKKELEKEFKRIV